MKSFPMVTTLVWITIWLYPSLNTFAMLGYSVAVRATILAVSNLLRHMRLCPNVVERNLKPISNVWTCMTRLSKGWWAWGIFQIPWNLTFWFSLYTPTCTLIKPSGQLTSDGTPNTSQRTRFIQTFGTLSLGLMRLVLPLLFGMMEMMIWKTCAQTCQAFDRGSIPLWGFRHLQAHAGWMWIISRPAGGIIMVSRIPQPSATTSDKAIELQITVWAEVRDP